MGMFGFRSQTRCSLQLGLQALLQRVFELFVLTEPWPGAACGWREKRSHMPMLLQHRSL